MYITSEFTSAAANVWFAFVQNSTYLSIKKTTFASLITVTQSGNFKSL